MRHVHGSKYLISLLIVSTAAGIQWFLWPIIAPAPFILFYPAVILASLYGHGISAIVLSSLLVQYLFVPPVYSLAVAWPADVVRQALFLVSAIMIEYLTRALTSAARTAQEQQEKAIQATTQSERREAWLSTTLSSIGDAVIATDEEGKVAFLNPVAEALTEWSLAEAKGQPLAEVFHIVNQQTRKLVENPVLKVLESGGVVGLANHTVIVGRKGKEATIEDSAAPIRISGSASIQGVVLVFRDITETYSQRERLAEAFKQLQLSEARTRSILESALDAVVGIDIEGVITHWNPQAEKIFGYTSEEAIGTRMADTIVPHQHREAHQRGMEHYRASGEGAVLGRRIQITALRRDGREFPIELAITPVKTANLTYFAAFIRDISEQKKSEVEMARLLQEADFERQRLLTMLEHMPAGVILADASGKPILRNRQMDQMLGGGRPAENIEEYGQYTGYKTDGSPYGPHDWPLARSLTQGETVKNEEVDFVRLDGRRATFSLSSAPLRDEAGSVIAGVVIHLDVSERKSTEKALRESEEMARIALSAGQMGDWDLDLVTGSAHRSLRHDQCFGYQALLPSWTYEDFLRHVHPDDRPSVDQKFKTAIQEGSDWRFECRVIWPDESVHWIAASGRATVGATGKPLRMAGMVQDITERKLTEEALQEAVRARDEFISICSYELKTPITSMKLQFQMAEKLLKKGDPKVFAEEQVKRRVLTANHQLDRMTNLIEEMLDVSRIGAGKLQMNFEPLDLAETSTAVMDRFAEQFTVLKLPVEFVVTPKSILIVGDRYRLEQVLSNLLTNAIKYGSGSAITVTLTTADGKARLTVQDRGIGIAKESLGLIFQRFERAISATNISGLGLGLFISQQIVEAHRGKIWAESELGHGATFTVEVPLSATTA